MTRYQFKQKVVIKETGEVKEIWRANLLWDGSYHMMDDTMYHESQFFVPVEVWQQNTILNVGAKNLKELAIAKNSAVIANQAIINMMEI